MYENEECPYKLDTTYCYELINSKIKRIEFTRNNWNDRDEVILQQFIDKNINIINICRRITNNISIDSKECNLKDLKYFADYYRLIKDYNKAIIFYNELVTRGVELANLNLADCYDKIGNNIKYNECFSKAKDTIVPVLKKMTEKKCYKINLEKNSKPGILDSKINGSPYIPIGEEYPVNKDGKPMSLILQINF